jgi:hypothetical protein
LTHIKITGSDDEGEGNPYETKKIRDKIKISQELGIAYDPDIDALGGKEDPDPAVIMRVKPLGAEHFTEVRIEDPVLIDVVDIPANGVSC